MSVNYRCASYGSLVMLSGLGICCKLGIMYLASSQVIPVSQRVSTTLCINKTSTYTNSRLLAMEIISSLATGISLSYLMQVLCNKMSTSQSSVQPIGLGLILKGRSKSGGVVRSMASSSALSIGSYTGSYLDLTVCKSVSTVGVLGVKLGIVI